MDWDFKIKNHTQFFEELNRLTGLHPQLNAHRSKGEAMIIETLWEIKEIVDKNKNPEYKQSSYANLLPYLEFNGGKEFLEQTQDGKDIIEIFFYFAYRWKASR